jgi:hypothetical protein
VPVKYVTSHISPKEEEKQEAREIALCCQRVTPLSTYKPEEANGPKLFDLLLSEKKRNSIREKLTIQS